MAMELPDEAILYNYQGLLAPVGEEWTPAAELRARHFLPPARLKDMAPRLMQVRGQVAAEREMRNAAAGDAAARRRLHRPAADAARPATAARATPATWAASSPSPPAARRGRPRRHPRHRRFAARRPRPVRGPQAAPTTTSCRPRRAWACRASTSTATTSTTTPCRSCSICLQITCVDPEQREERWAVVVISKSGRDAGAGRGPARLPPRGDRVLRPALRVAAQLFAAGHRAGEQAARPVQGATATTTPTC